MKLKVTNSAAVRRGRGHGARRGCAGFTIVELLIALGVLMVVSAMAVPALSDAIKSAKIARAVASSKGLFKSTDGGASMVNEMLPTTPAG